MVLMSALLLSLLVMTCSAQSDQSSLQVPLALFFDTKFDQALPLLKELSDKDHTNVDARTWLAETYRRLGRKDEAILSARIALSLSPSSSFAHLVLAQASYPNIDTISVHVTKAVECDSTDPNAWLMMWGEAIRNADPVLRNRSLRKLVETGFFTKAALAYGRAELATLPANSIFITNGDMDTYPAQAVQVVEDLRADVAVIEREHLGIPWGCRFIRDHQKVPLPFSDTQLDFMKDTADNTGGVITRSDIVFKALLDQKRKGQMLRPIALAPTVEQKFYSAERDHFKYQGMFYLWEPLRDDGIADTLALRRCLAGIEPDSFSGPWASEKDRSPIRRYYTKEIVQVLFQIALTYSEALVKAKRLDEAEKTLQWLESFEKNTELGRVSIGEIARLRDAIKQHSR